MKDDFINKSFREPTALFLNVFIAIIIYLNAEMGSLLGFTGQALPISVVWPATGFAVGALLLFGPTFWQGIFIGNFAYNFLHLFTAEQAFFGPLLVSSIKSTGSLMQAFLSFWIMKSCSSSRYFGNIKDVLIFLGPASLLACMVSSTIGVTTLYFYGSLGSHSFLSNWVAFWVGDSMGVYLLTPLLVVWATQRTTMHLACMRLACYKYEPIWMGIVFCLLSFLTFVLDLPIAMLYILLCLWVTYHFGMRGATVALFMVAFVSIIATARGRGSFVAYVAKSELLILVTFLEVIVANSLIFAAVRNESRREF